MRLKKNRPWLHLRISGPKGRQVPSTAMQKGSGRAMGCGTRAHPTGPEKTIDGSVCVVPAPGRRFSGHVHTSHEYAQIARKGSTAAGAARATREIALKFAACNRCVFDRPALTMQTNR